jgi:hypothetical protein
MSSQLPPLRTGSLAEAIASLRGPLQILDQKLRHDSPSVALHALHTVAASASAHSGYRCDLGVRVLRPDAGWPVRWATCQEILGRLPAEFVGTLWVTFGHVDIENRDHQLEVSLGIWPYSKPQPSTVPWRTRALTAEREQRLWRRQATLAHEEMRGMFKGASACLYAASDLVHATDGPESAAGKDAEDKSSPLTDLARGATDALLERYGAPRHEDQPPPAPPPARQEARLDHWVTSRIWLAQVLGRDEGGEPMGSGIALRRVDDGWSLHYLGPGSPPRLLGTRPAQPNTPWRRDPDVLEWARGVLRQEGLTDEEGEDAPGLGEVIQWRAQQMVWETRLLAVDGRTTIRVELGWCKGAYTLNATRPDGRPGARFERKGPAKPPRAPGDRVMTWVTECLHQVSAANAAPEQPPAEE